MILTILFVFLLTGCELIPFTNGTTLETTEETTEITTENTTIPGENSETLTDTTTETTETKTTTVEVPTTTITTEKKEYKTIKLSSSNSNISTSYSTGNYGYFICSNTSFEYYRAVGSKYLVAELINYSSLYGDGGMGGALYNSDPIYDIESITIKYNTDYDEIAAGYLYFGENIVLDECYSIYSSSESVTETFDISGSNFFKIITSSDNIYIEEITIKYTDTFSSYDTTYKSCGNGQVRLNPVVFEGELIPGVSTVKVVTRLKPVSEGHLFLYYYSTLTYYTLEYVEDHPEVVEDATYTAPNIIIAYYSAFGTYPANYTTSKNWNKTYEIFGENTRRVSTEYSRTDGYVQYVPYATMDGDVSYIELDIALDDTYSKTNRGVGRVVIFFYGFDSTNYNGSIVGLYTDDHYSTFQEYYNTGQFGSRFNAEQNCTNYTYGEPDAR